MNAVLVLNQDFTPLTICSVNRAFLLVFLRKAELLKEVKSKKLRTVSKTFPFPSVIRIEKYVHLPYKSVVLTRHNIFKRDNHRCQYCGTTKNLTLDHLIPKSKGGKSSWTNLVTACQECNTKKGDSSIEKTGMTLETKPFKPSYISFLKMGSNSLNDDWKQFLEPKKFSA